MDDAIVFGRYLVMAGGIRFAIEFLRVQLPGMTGGDVPVVGPFTLAHLVSFGLMVAGAVTLLLYPRSVRVLD